MKRELVVSVVLLLPVWIWPGQQQAVPPVSPDEKLILVEGRIVSVDMTNRTLVLTAKIEKEDTFDVGTAVIVKPEEEHVAIRDLVRNSLVRVRYTVRKGLKVATHILVQPFRKEVPSPIVKGENAIVSEGVIQSINDRGDVMVIRAAVETQDTFAIDSAAEIKSGRSISTLDEIGKYVSVNVQYIKKEGRNVIRTVIGIDTKNAGKGETSKHRDRQ